MMSPDITKASLLANNTRLPALTAASVGNKPAAPTMAAITTSTSGCSATAIKPASSLKISIPEMCCCASNCCNSSTFAAGTTTILG